jgi:nitrite reductase/ring-hydroxylating ferredoxin subunit
MELDLTRVLCAVRELDDPGARGFTVGAGDWPLQGFLVRRGATIRAYRNRCPHAGHPLNLLPHRFLTPDRSLIVCSSHGALFEFETGYCVDGPCPGQSLTPLPIEIQNGYVLLAAAAQPTADGVSAPPGDAGS